MPEKKCFAAENVASDGKTGVIGSTILADLVETYDAVANAPRGAVGTGFEKSMLGWICDNPLCWGEGGRSNGELLHVQAIVSK